MVWLIHEVVLCVIISLLFILRILLYIVCHFALGAVVVFIRLALY